MVGITVFFIYIKKIYIKKKLLPNNSQILHPNLQIYAVARRNSALSAGSRGFRRLVKLEKSAQQADSQNGGEHLQLFRASVGSGYAKGETSFLVMCVAPGTVPIKQMSWETNKERCARRADVSTSFRHTSQPQRVADILIKVVINRIGGSGS